jgi:hypothetical protein
VVVIQNVCITLAMYALVLFYHAVAKELQPFKPIPKFLCIKAIIGFAFWFYTPRVLCVCVRACERTRMEHCVIADSPYSMYGAGRA